MDTNVQTVLPGCNVQKRQKKGALRHMYFFNFVPWLILIPSVYDKYFNTCP